ncbi:hypothetical protein [Thermoactinomyces sp. DSM 45892]|uniref:hypothetical protein n=1 Tax=Thermoactinomyces sp. DSM 45892 TaxID=1882753 RepID=UPI00089D2AD9|nr:hypothetical protein [Thermoactinomyces sp. DSM 45892]SDY38060.1 hypothetical protein SAMN05444416_10497 [Thermoactinomyces sp. DSM 45892]
MHKAWLIFLIACIMTICTVPIQTNAKSWANPSLDKEVSVATCNPSNKDSKGSYYEITDLQKIRHLQNLTSKQRLEFHRSSASKEFRLEETARVFQLNQQTWVYYPVKSGYGYGFMGIGIKTSTNEVFITKALLATTDDKSHEFKMYDNNKEIARFSIAGGLASGWILKDGTQKDVADLYKDLKGQGFWNCFTNCMDDQKTVPDWVVDGVALVCGTLCTVAGPTPPCWACVSVQVGLFLGEATKCLRKCW